MFEPNGLKLLLYESIGRVVVEVRRAAFEPVLLLELYILGSVLGQICRVERVERLFTDGTL